MKDGSKCDITCPEMISFYRQIMGGVDLTDQVVGLYDLDRKWWKKVFYRLFMMAIVNSWIIYNESQNKRTPLIQFLVPLAEEMIAEMLKVRKQLQYSG